jgi:hypothetical protein
MDCSIDVNGNIYTYFFCNDNILLKGTCNKKVNNVIWTHVLYLYILYMRMYVCVVRVRVCVHVYIKLNYIKWAYTKKYI